MYHKVIILGCLVVGLMGGWGYGMGTAPKSSVSTKAIDFTLKDLSGVSHTLSDYKGKIVFLNFWATWCPPCRAEMPAMQKLYQSWDKNKFVMLAVDIGEDKSRVAAFVKENNYTFPVLLDRDKSVATKYKIRGIPTTYLIDQEGKIITRVVGAREWTLKEFQRLIK